MKLSIRHISIKKISKREPVENIIRRMKKQVKKEPSVKEKFNEYGVDLGVIDGASVTFCTLDVSAKTKDKKIYINERFLDDLDNAASYLCHEVIHLAQQISGNLQGANAKDYLDKKTEIDAFEAQLDYKEEHEGRGEAEKYVDNLLEYHKVPRKERKEKKEELLND